MFKRIHVRLTLVFTGISGLILIILSLNYMYISEQSLRSNAYHSFQSDINTLLTNLEGQSVITYEWLSKMESNGKYLIGIYDNESDLSFIHVTKNAEEQALLLKAKEYYEKQFDYTVPENKLNAIHTEFKFTSSDNEKYYSSVAVFSEASGNLKVVILYSLKNLTSQVLKQRISFLAIDLFFLFTLTIFCWYYTKHLLKPIEISQKKQVQFVAAASHELRTPLSVILSSLSAWKKADASQKEVFMQTIQNEGYQMAKLIDDMLLLANADSHAWTIHKENVEIDTLLLDCFEAFRPVAKEHHISLYVQLPEETLPHCPCDKRRMEQVISIFIHNAISYGKPNGSVTLSLKKDTTHFTITIADDGIGIADKDKPYIFDRFYRADTSRSKKEHFGLGLSIAKEIVEAHKGFIRLEDTKGGGATFIIYLPCV